LKKMAKANILIVEDDRITADIIKKALTNLGYAVTSIASTRKEALKRAEEQKPDLVLMDIMLKGKMEGIEAADQIRSNFNIPVIYLTAYSDDQTLKRARITDPFGYILKPFETKELHTAIEIALHKHEMERKLRETQEWLSTALKNIGDAVIATDIRGFVTYMNLMAELMTGWNKDEALGEKLSTVFKITSSERGEKVRNVVTDVMKKGAVLDLNHNLLLKNKTGEKIPISLNGAPIRGKKGNITEVVFAFRDLSERQQMEEVLENTKASFHSIVERNNDGIIIVDRNRTVRFANPRGLVFLGKNDRRYVGKKFQYPVSKIKSGEIKISRTNGKPGVGEVQVVETEWESKPGYLISIRDITDRKRLFGELEKAHQQQIETRDQFLSHISHELRTPLSAILQFVTILLDGLDGEINPSQKEDLEIILRNSKHLNLMIRDLLDVTRAITGRLDIDPQPISILDVVAGTVDAFKRKATSKGISLCSEIQKELPSVYADSARICQVLSNLVDNAIKFTPENETISIRASLYRKDPDFICVEVADTGLGIDPDAKKKIFEYLYQAIKVTVSSRQGLGLGLFISKEIIFRHGGEIWVKSVPGKGSTFYFTLPVFSIARLLAPILTSDCLQRGFLTLFNIKIFPLDKPFPSQIWENIILVVQEVLQSSLFQDSEVLLPTMNSSESGKTFFLVAKANKKEAEGMVKRIKRQLELCDILQSTGIEPIISFSKINIPRENISTQLDQIATKVMKKMGKEVENNILLHGESK